MQTHLNGGQVNKFGQNQDGTWHMRKQNAIWLDKVETNQFASKIAFAYTYKKLDHPKTKSKSNPS